MMIENNFLSSHIWNFYIQILDENTNYFVLHCLATCISITMAYYDYEYKGGDKKNILTNQHYFPSFFSDL